MNKKYLLPLGIGLGVLALALIILCCCLAGSNEDPALTTDPAASTSPATTQPADTVPAPTDTTPAETTPTETEPTETEPVLLYHNPLTGEPMEEAAVNRPYAIMLNNIKAAMPQHGISAADVLLEVLAEGGITRCMGIFYDVSEVEAFGSIRSARPYFIELAQGFDALFVHAGASAAGRQYLANTGWNNLDGVKGTNASKYFYRNQDRLNAGYSLEHTLFIKSTGILEYTEKLGYETTRPNGVNFGWQFGEGIGDQGEAAENVSVYFGPSTNSKLTSFAYNADDGLYYASQYGTEHIDGATGQQLSYRNLLVLKTSVTRTSSDSKQVTIETTGSGTGCFVCNGKVISIRWSRESVTDPFVFTTEDGEILELGIGKTYLAVVPTNALLRYS